MIGAAQSDTIDETLDRWLDQQIEYAENECGMFRSYKKINERAEGYRDALKFVRAKMRELWDSK